MNKVAKLNESSRVSMAADDGKSKFVLNEDTLGVGRMARNVLSETMALPQRGGKSLKNVLNHLGAKSSEEPPDSDPSEPVLIRRSASHVGVGGSRSR